MGAISAGNLTLLRNRADSQYAVERLYAFGFPAMWKGRLNDSSIARADQTIAYDTGAMESGFVFGNLVADLLLFIGSSEGADDKGRRRILSISGTATSGTIVVDWNDDVNWADNDFLTIVHFYPPWPKYSWFTATGPDFRKDGPPSGSGGAGVDYADQNEQPPPLVVMGPHYATEFSSPSVAVQLSAANSQAVADGASISSYSWSVVPTAGASFDNASIAAPTITFTTDNTKYWVSCTVTDSNSKTATGRRAYIIGGGVTEFSRGAITETYDNPAVNVAITTTSPDITWTDFADRTLVIITSTDYYGTTQQAISFRDGAQYTDHLHILYVGYLWSENDDLIDDGTGQVVLNAVSTLPMFLYSISLTGVDNATDWYEMNKELMTVAANIFHLLKYQSTLLDIMDWHLPWTDTVKRSANEEFNEGSLLDRLRALAAARLMGVTAAAMGEVWVETDLNLRSSSDRTAATTTLTLSETATAADLTGTKRVRVRQYGDHIRVILDGGASTGLLGSFTPFLSASQHIATAEGRPQMLSVTRLMLPDQTEANRLAGRIASVANNKYQEVNLELAGNYRGVFSPADQQKVNLGTVFGSGVAANIRGYADLESADVIVRSVTINHSDGITSVSLIADIMAAEGLTGVTLTAPTVPQDAIEPGSGGDPNFEQPDPPVFPPVPPDQASPAAAIGVDQTSGVYMTFDSGTGWETRNGGLATANGFHLALDPWWKTAFGNNSNNAESAILWWSGTGYIRRSTDAGRNWTDLTPFLPTPTNDAADSPAPAVSDLTYTFIQGNIHTNAQFMFIAEWDSDAAGDYRGWLLKTTDNGENWTQIQLA